MPFHIDQPLTPPAALSLHAALPISSRPTRCTATSRWTTPIASPRPRRTTPPARTRRRRPAATCWCGPRSEEHTSELQSRGHLVCRLLLEKKKFIAVRYSDNVDSSDV